MGERLCKQWSRFRRGAIVTGSSLTNSIRATIVTFVNIIERRVHPVVEGHRPIAFDSRVQTFRQARGGCIKHVAMDCARAMTGEATRIWLFRSVLGLLEKFSGMVSYTRGLKNLGSLRTLLPSFGSIGCRWRKRRDARACGRECGWLVR